MSGHAAARADLLQAAARFDDDALAHLANRGLVRRARKLLTTGPVSTEATDGALDVVGDGWRVSFPDGTTPADGRCGCATAGICQHLIAAITHLRDEVGPSAADEPDQKQSDPDEPEPDKTEPDKPGPDEPHSNEPDPDEGLRARLLDTDIDTIRAWGTPAALRWAHARLLDLDASRVVVEEGVNLLVELPPPHGSIRFLGPSPDDAMAKPSGRHDRRRVLLAVLVLRQMAGRDIPEPPPVPAGETELLSERTTVVERVGQVVGDLIGVGLLHLTDTDRERLDSLSASARGAKLYRLSILAERASDHVAALEDLAPDADTGRLLDQLAELATVAEVIGRLLAAGSPLPEALTGRARARYEDAGGLRLAGLGHYEWGDRRFGGLTAVLFAGPSNGYTVTRPTTASGRSLDASLGWSGIGSVGGLTGHWIAVEGAAVSEDMRLSAAGSTSATPDRRVAAADFDALAWDGTRPPVPSRLWQRAADPWRLIPVDDEVEAVRFDSLAQRSVWIVRSRGELIEVTVSQRRSTTELRGNLEAAARSGAVSHIVGRLRNLGDRLELWPISVVMDGRLVELSWDEPATETQGPLRRLLPSRPSGSTRPGSPPPPAPAPAPAPDGPPPAPGADIGDRLDRFDGAVLAMAERGRRSADTADLDRLAGSAREVGLDVLEQTVTAAPGPTEAVLRSAWLLRTLRELD